MEILGRLKQQLRDHFDNVVKMFMANSTISMTDLGKALTDNDVKAVRRLTHSLKSTTRQMGAIKLADYILAMEHLCDDADINIGKMQGIMSDARQEHVKVKDAMQKIV
jgi:HPt (histidine-containing phosphotransfer) domain-containing protein